MSNSDRPATIAFGDDHDEGPTGFENFGEGAELIEEEEIESRPAPRRKPEAMKGSNKVPSWIFLVGGGIILAGVLGGGLMVFSKMKNRAAQEEELLSMQAPVNIPQPVIQMASPPQALPQAQLLPEPQATVGGPGLPQAAVVPPGVAVPVQDLSPGASNPLAGPVASIQAPSAVVQPNPAPAVLAAIPEKVHEKNVDIAKLAAIEEDLSKVLGQIEDMNGRIAKLESTLNKPEVKTPAKPAAAPARPANKAAEGEKSPAPVKQVAAPKPAVKPAPAKSQEPRPVDKDKEKAKPGEDSKQATSTPVNVQGYSVSSLIGTRAWLVKRNNDGTETELSVAPGERVEGKLVTSVDGASKAVVLEGGQRITVRK